MPINYSGVRYSGAWTLQSQMQAVAAGTWPGIPALYAWGQNANGRLGLNDVISRSSPVQVGTSSTWAKIASGLNHTIAIKTDGTLWSWGANPQGQLGQNDVIYRSSPVQIGALTTWSSIANHSRFSIAIKTDGTLWLWGYNNYGQLGNNTTYNSSSPIQIGALTTWSKITGGNLHAAAIKTDGTLWTWGRNNTGSPLGQNTGVGADRSSPVQVGALTTWLSIAAGHYSTLATKTDGTLWTWGYNFYGQLGKNDIVDRSSPVQVGALTTWSNLGGGAYFSAITKTDGTFWAWGQNASGQLSQNDTANRSSPVQVGALTTWLSVSKGWIYNVAAIKTDGTLWVWGSNTVGQLGQGDTTNRSSSVQVGASTTWSLTATGNNFVIAIGKTS